MLCRYKTDISFEKQLSIPFLTKKTLFPFPETCQIPPQIRLIIGTFYIVKAPTFTAHLLHKKCRLCGSLELHFWFPKEIRLPVTTKPSKVLSSK